MPLPQTPLAELRSLEAKRAQGALSEPEALRLRDLQAFLAPPAAPGGFDVRRAAEAVKLSMASADAPLAEPDLSTAAGQETTALAESAADPALLDPEPAWTAAPEPVESTGVEPPSPDLAAPPAVADSLEPEVRPEDPAAQPEWDPNAQQTWDPYDPAAYAQDPGAQPQRDPNAQQTWDPNAQPYDPAAYAQDPGAQPQWDPNAPQTWDPNAPPYDPAAYAPDPNAQTQWDPNDPRTWDPNAPPYDTTAHAPDPAAEGQWASGSPDGAPEAPGPPEPIAAVEFTQAWDMGSRSLPRSPGAGASQGLEARRSFSADLGGAGDPGAPEPTAAWSLPTDSVEDFRHELPADWSAEEAQERLDDLRPASSGSFPPIELTEIPEEEARAFSTGASDPTLSLQLPPVTPAEEAILEVGGDVQELPGEESPEVVDLLEEVTRPVPEVAQDASAPERPAAPAPEPPATPIPPAPGPAAAALAPPVPEVAAAPPGPPAPPPAEAEPFADLFAAAGTTETSDWEPDITVEETSVAAVSPPPQAELPAGEPVSLDFIGAVEAPPDPPARPSPPIAPPPPPPVAAPVEPPVQVAPAPPPPEPPPAPWDEPDAPALHALVGSFRVVVHTVDGQVKRGTLLDPTLEVSPLELHLPDGGSDHLPVDRVRAIFFMLTQGEPPAAPDGARVRVTFRDGRQVAGFSPDYDPAAPGFFMIPADTRTNTARIWVYRSAVRQMSVSE